MNILRRLPLLALLATLTGCAGGWRGGVAPAQWADGTVGDATIAASAASATSKSSTAASGVTTADGTTFTWSGEGASVALAGEFNAWSTSADPLTKQADGSWRLVKKLEPGRYMYKFVVDGTNWKPDPNATDKADDGFGGTNSVVNVGAGAVVPAAARPAVAGKGPVSTTDGTVFKWSGEGASVALAGEFNAWSTNADPLSKQADGSWSLVKKLEPGRYMYKFVVDGTNWKPDPDASDKADDGFGGTNSVVIVGAAGSTTVSPTPSVPTTARPASPGKGPANTADGTAFTWSGEGASVALAGDFNAWSTSADPMTKQPDGSWKLVKKLEPGRYMYKFVVDGMNWKPDPNASEKADDGFGGSNSVVIVGAGGAASAAASGTTTPAASSPATVTGSARAPVISADGVLFTHAVAARSVSLCGDFNAWAPLADAMAQQPDGTWTLRKKLAAGRHQYKFLVDGSKWSTDPANPVSEDDGFGGKNSVIVVK